MKEKHYWHDVKKNFDNTQKLIKRKRANNRSSGKTKEESGTNKLF